MKDKGRAIILKRVKTYGFAVSGLSRGITSPLDKRLSAREISAYLAALKRLPNQAERITQNREQSSRFC